MVFDDATWCLMTSRGDLMASRGDLMKSQSSAMNGAMLSIIYTNGMPVLQTISCALKI